MLTAAQRKAMMDALASVNTIRPQVEYLERVAQGAPHLAEDVADLRTRMDYLQTFCETAIAADQGMSA